MSKRAPAPCNHLVGSEVLGQQECRPPSRDLSGRSGIEVPEEPVITSADRIGCDTVRHEEVGFPPGPVVPLCAPSGYGQVRPTIGDTHDTKVDMAGPVPIIGKQCVGGTGVALTDDQLAHRWRYRHQAEGLVNRKFAVHGVPAPPAQEPGRAPVAGVRDPLLGRPAERATIDRERIVERTEPLPDRSHRCRRVGEPPLAYG
jgi:hypothetical protein